MPSAPLSIEVKELRTGRAVPFGPGPHRSGIHKQPVERPVMLSETGLDGDEQGDTRHHGGAEKALHHYPFEHYATWCDQRPSIAWRLAEAGAFGENIVTSGLTEADVCVGDVFSFGSAQIQVSQARQPCWRLNVRFGNRRMARWVQHSGRTGWYYRVMQSGRVQAGDALTLIERPQPDWSLARILHFFYVDPLNAEALEAIAALPGLAQRWRDLAARRLQRAAVEDWAARVDTPSHSRGKD